MDARNLHDHLEWCRKMSRSWKFVDLDRDDVFSTALVSAWKALDCAELKHIIPLRNRIFRKDIHDLRRHIYARKRSPRHCHHFSHDEKDDGEDFRDRSLDNPLDILIARETVAPLAAFLEAHGYPPSPPCVRCGTLGGMVRGDGTSPRRTEGLCHTCYQKTWNARRRHAKQSVGS